MGVSGRVNVCFSLFVVVFAGLWLVLVLLVPTAMRCRLGGMTRVGGMVALRMVRVGSGCWLDRSAVGSPAMDLALAVLRRSEGWCFYQVKRRRRHSGNVSTIHGNDTRSIRQKSIISSGSISGNSNDHETTRIDQVHSGSIRG